MSVSEIFEYFGLRRDPKPAAAEASDEAPVFEETPEDEGTDPSTPLRSAQDDRNEPDAPAGAAIGRPPEAEASEESVPELVLAPEPALSAEPAPEPVPGPELVFSSETALEPEPEQAAAPEPELELAPEAALEPAPEAEEESWDPLSLFIEPEADDPASEPLSRDTTGRLPTLEELFGAAPAPKPRETQPRETRSAERPAPLSRVRGWLSALLGAVRARIETPEDEGTDPSTPLRSAQDDRNEPDAPVGAAIGRPPEAEAFDEEPMRSAADDADETEENDDTEENEADDWDPLALFGGQAEDADLPTWEEYVRARRPAPEPEPIPEPDAPAGAAVGRPPEAEASDEAPVFEETPEDEGTDPSAPLRSAQDDRNESDGPVEAAAEPAAGPIPASVEAWAEAETFLPEPTDATEPAAPEPSDAPERTEAPGAGKAGIVTQTLAEFVAAVAPEEEPPAPARIPDSEDQAGAEPEDEAGTAPEQPPTLAPEEPAAVPPAEDGADLSLDWAAFEAEDFLQWDSRPSDTPETPAEELREKPAKKRKKEKQRWPWARRTAAPEAETASEAVEAEAAETLLAADVAAAAQAARPSGTPIPEKAPVPSADVRGRAGEKRPKQTEYREREEELPPEETQPLLPEEAYRVYAKPLDSISTRLIVTGLLAMLSLFFTLYLSQRWTFLPEIFSGGTTVYILLALLGLMVLTNRRLYFVEWRDETGLRPGLLLGLATVFTALDCISAAKTLRPPFTVVIGALLLVELWGRYDRGLGLITTVKVLREEKLSAGVSEVQDITKGSRGLIRTQPDVVRFMEKLETRDLTDRLLRIYTPVAVGLGLALTLLLTLWLKRDPFWAGALVFLGTVPVTGLLAYSRLFCLLARRLAEAQAALCGYHGAEVFGGEHSILIGDDDIFPAGSLTLNGFKVYNGNPDRVIAYAAAACRSSGSALDPIFEDLLVTHNGRHYTVDNFRFYDSGGIGASLQQDVVLMGSLDFMKRMGVHMDRGARVKQAVYMSLNGELAAVFAVRYNPPDNLRKGLAAIAGNRHFKGILVTRTFLGTPGFLKVKFGIPTGAFAYPSTKERIRLSEAEMKRSGAQGAILAQDSFSGFAQAAAGGRLLRSATLGAAILTVLGGLTGLVLMGVLAALGAYETATALNVLLYVAAWLAPTLLLTVWGRHF